MKGKRRQIYSEDFKKEKVMLLEKGELRVCELVKMYGVSASSVHKWKKKYGKYPSQETVVVEKNSEYQKNRELQTEIIKLERLIGRQQISLDYYKEVIIQANKALEIDIEKKFASK